MTCTVIVLSLVESKKSRDGHRIYTFTVADSSGSIRCSLWDDSGKYLKPGDVVRLTEAYSSLFKDCLTLLCHESGKVEKIDELCLVYSQVPNMSEIKWIKDKNNPSQLVPEIHKRSHS